MTIAILLLSVIIAVIVVPAIQRLFDLKKIPPLAVLVVLGATASPLYVASTVLDPGEPLQTATVAAQKDTVNLTIPEGHSLMVTAKLSEDEDKEKESKTSYAFRVKGEKWAENLTGTIKRSGGTDNVEIEADGNTITESGRRRSGAAGETLQERHDLKHSGEAEVVVTNYNGGAAEALILEVVKGPPSVIALMGFAVLISILGLYLELKQGCERFSGDMATLAFYGALIPQAQITPLNNIAGLAFMGLGALLLGQGAVQAIAWVANKYLASLDKDEEPEEPEPETRRRKRRR